VNPIVDAFWRAAAYCLHPRLILWSLAPVLIAGGVVFGFGWLFWADAIDAVQAALGRWDLLGSVFGWLESLGASNLRAVIAPLIVVALAVPVVVVLTLLLVAVLMTPAIVALVGVRRFPQLERRRGAGWWQTVAWSALSTLLALVVIVVSLPLWFVPPVGLVLPPIIWGWLTYRVFAFEVLAEHASADERRQVLRDRRGPLLAMGIVSGLMGAAPSLVWAFGAMTLVFAPLLLIVSVWLYTLVFAFAAAWFAHYCLAALERRRSLDQAAAASATVIDLAPPPTTA
jgi:hypothetical protein